MRLAPAAAVALLVVAALPDAAAALEKVPLARAAGAPVLAPGTGPVYALWWDAAGWHLRWTGKREKKLVFTGLVSVPTARISIIKPAGMVGGDDSLNRLDATRAMFKSESSDTVEGIDFKVGEGATSLYLELFVDYDVIAPATVRLGKDALPATDISPMLQIDLTSPPAGAVP